MNQIDFLILLLYLFTCSALGFYKLRFVVNIRNYVLGTGKFSTPVLISTFFATAIGTGATVGITNSIHKFGIVFALPLMCVFISRITTAEILAMSKKRFSNLLTLNQIMYQEYKNSGLLISNCTSLLQCIGSVTLQLIGMGNLLTYFFGIPYPISVTFIALFINFYCFLGGIRSVVITDFFQFIVFFISLPIACGVIFKEIGGFQALKTVVVQDYQAVKFDTSTISTFLAGPVVPMPILPELNAVKTSVPFT